MICICLLLTGLLHYQGRPSLEQGRAEPGDAVESWEFACPSAKGVFVACVDIPW